MSDAINPDHYKRLPAEAIEIIEAAIDNAPSNQDAYLHGQALKYLLRCWHKNGIEDLRKAKWYLDRLIGSFNASKPEQPAWTPKLGDWVRIKKPSSDKRDSVLWSSFMDEHDKEVVQVKEIKDGAMVHGEWFFPFEWLEPAEQPKPTLNSDKIPDGYRKLGDSSIEPRQRGDLRWSIAEKRYIEIGFDEIGYANRDNWAACRRTTGEVTGEVKPPMAGWRWLEVGEVIRKGDRYFDGNQWKDRTCAISEKYSPGHSKTIRRNKFEAGERVFLSKSDDPNFFRVKKHINDKLVLVYCDGIPFQFFSDHLAPYIEETK